MAQKISRKIGEGKQKKVLSLVLCVAMMLSVMVVGAGAAFSDQSTNIFINPFFTWLYDISHKYAYSFFSNNSVINAYFN